MIPRSNGAPTTKSEWEDPTMSFDLYAWKSPRDLDADAAEALLDAWNESGGDPGNSPFEPSSDVAWFYRELIKDEPELGASSDAVPNPSTAPIWLATTDEAPARVVRIPVSAATPGGAVDTIFSLAAKYDLVVYDTQSRRIHRPLDEMAAYASATFWSAGAIQAAVAGGIGLIIAIVAWILGIPVLSGIVIVIGGFLVVMAVFTFVREGRKAMKGRRQTGE
jgi:hypothetical protein